MSSGGYPAAGWRAPLLNLERDAYAAGILYSISHGIDMDRAGMIAVFIAAQVVASRGARVGRSLVDEIKSL